MLFVNMSSGAQFHMNNVGVMLSIASLDKDFNVLDVAEMEPNLGGYRTVDGTKHVLEGSPDFFERLGIVVGVDLQKTLTGMRVDEDYFKGDGPVSLSDQCLLSDPFFLAD